MLFRSMPSLRIIEAIFILICILVLCIGLWYFIVIPIALNILFKLFFHIVFCGRLKGFSIFSAIVINGLPQSNQRLQYSGYLAGLVANKNYLLYTLFHGFDFEHVEKESAFIISNLVSFLRELLHWHKYSMERTMKARALGIKAL